MALRHASVKQLRERISERFYRDSTMTEIVFFIERQLRETFVEAIDHENRIVAEAAGAVGAERDVAAAIAAKQSRFAAGPAERDHAGKLRAALGERDAFEFAQQFADVVGEGAAESRVARGVNAGAAVERIDEQAGVVGDRPFAADLQRSLRFDNRVGVKRRA